MDLRSGEPDTRGDVKVLVFSKFGVPNSSSEKISLRMVDLDSREREPVVDGEGSLYPDKGDMSGCKTFGTAGMVSWDRGVYAPGVDGVVDVGDIQRDGGKAILDRSLAMA